MSYEAALHSYLHVGDVLGARLVGLRGATYLDATEAGFPPKLQEQPSVMFGDQPVDRWCGIPESRAATPLPMPRRVNGVALWPWRQRRAETVSLPLVRVNRICFRSPLP